MPTTTPITVPRAAPFAAPRSSVWWTLTRPRLRAIGDRRVDDPDAGIALIDALDFLEEPPCPHRVIDEEGRQDLFDLVTHDVVPSSRNDRDGSPGHIQRIARPPATASWCVGLPSDPPRASGSVGVRTCALPSVSLGVLR